MNDFSSLPYFGKRVQNVAITLTTYNYKKSKIVPGLLAFALGYIPFFLYRFVNCDINPNAQGEQKLG